MKRTFMTVLLGIVLATVAITSVWAITRLVMVRSKRSDYKKAVIFSFDLNDGFLDAELTPGDSTSVSPSIYCNSTESMYGFMKLTMTLVGSGDPLYTYKVNDDWVLIEENELGNRTRKEFIYAYADDDGLIPLFPGDTTPTLTDSLKMRSMSIPDYAYIGDINVELIGATIQTEGESTDPLAAWAECKQYGVGL